MWCKKIAWQAMAVLTACFLTVFVAFSIRYSYGTLLPKMLEPLTITKAQAGSIFSSYFIANCLLSPIIGILSDRCNIRYLLTFFVIIMGVGTFLMQYSTSLIQASIFFAIAGFGSAACWGPVIVVSQRWTSDSKRGLVISLIDAGSTIGVMTAGMVIPKLVAGSNWQMGWSVMGMATIAAGVINFICIRNHPQKTLLDKSSTSGNIFHNKTTFSYKSLLKNRLFWLIAMAYLFNGFAIIIPFTFLSTFAYQELSLSYGSASALITIVGIGGLFGKLILGPLSDKIGRARIMLICAVLITGGSLGMPISSGILLQIVSFLFGVGYGACWAMYAACASDYFPKEAAGGIIGIWSCYLGIGSILGPLISGWIADAGGTLKWAFIIAGVGGTISLVLILALLKLKGTARGG